MEKEELQTMLNLNKIDHSELKIMLQLLTDSWDDVVDTLETDQIRGQIELHLSSLKGSAEQVASVKEAVRQEKLYQFSPEKQCFVVYHQGQWNDSVRWFNEQKQILEK